ncbi:MAG: LytTR family DNA-binding domain-containing protein [Bacteroidota bacterium]
MYHSSPAWWPAAGTSLLVRTDGRNQRIPVTDILFLRAEHVYVNLQLVGGKRLLQRGSLSALVERLPAQQFLRVHRGYVVNLAAITSWSREAVFVGEHQLPISRARRAEVLSRLEIS